MVSPSEHQRTIAFLLSLGSVPMGCVERDGGDDEGGGTTTGAGGEDTYGAPCSEVEIPDACRASVAKYIECYPEYASQHADYLYDCACYADAIRHDSAACGDALEELYACIGGLSCEEYMGEGDVCVAESTAFENCG